MSEYDFAVHARAVAGDANYDHAPVIHDLCDEIARLRAENARLREALQPFAETALYAKLHGIPLANAAGVFEVDAWENACAALKGETP